MASKRRTNLSDNRPVLALQIGHTKVRALTFRQAEGEIIESRSLEEDWQDGGLVLSSPEGRRGLHAAVRKVLQQMPKNVDSAYLALSGEFCVTRVVSDTNENVMHEVREIESRSSLYLSLGHGPKVAAGNIVQQDPRHQHATVSVVHRETVETILEVTRSLGLSVIAIEPTVISLCRLMGAMRLDQDAPALLVCPGQSGVEIAISFRGQLYLDYRPAGIQQQEEIAEVLVHHLERLQRYCRRHARVMNRSIESVYLSGERFRADAIREQLGERLGMPVQILETSVEGTTVAPLLNELPISYFPAAGVGLLAVKEHATPGPNLMERLNAELEEPLLPRALRVLGPLAAVILLAVGAWGYLLEQRWELQQETRQAAELEPLRVRTQRLQNTMKEMRELLKMHQQVTHQLPRPPIDQWVEALGAAVPEEAWLTSMSLDADGDANIEGNSSHESGVYQYAERLGQLPFVGRSSIAGAIPTSTSAGPAVKFTIHCDINDQEGLEGSSDDSI